jgi:hypothetical protein
MPRGGFRLLLRVESFAKRYMGRLGMMAGSAKLHDAADGFADDQDRSHIQET